MFPCVVPRNNEAINVITLKAIFFGVAIRLYYVFIFGATQYVKNAVLKSAQIDAHHAENLSTASKLV